MEKIDKNKTIIKCGTLFTQRKGKENIVGSATGTIYPILNSLSLYHDNSSNFFATLAHEKNKKIPLQMACTIGYEQQHMKYKYPRRILQTQHIYAKIETQTTKNIKNLKLTLRALAEHHTPIYNSLTLPYASMQPSFIKYATHNYNFLKSKKSLLQTELRTDWKLKHTISTLFITLNTSMMFTSVQSNAKNITINMGITF